MELGRLKQKSSWFLTGFVMGCVVTIVLILYIAVKAEEKAQEYSYRTGDFSQYLDF